jgi:hypothetical protein
MSNLFDFIVKNANYLEEIILNDDGDIEIPVDEFDFSHPDLEVETDNETIVFTIPIAVFSLKARISIDNLNDATKHLAAIKDASLRKSVIEAIEENYRADADVIRESAKEEYEQAEARLKAAQKDFDGVVDALGDLKGAWNIP